MLTPVALMLRDERHIHQLVKIMPSVCYMNCVGVGHNCIYTPYMTVCMVIPLPKNCIYTVYTYKCMVLANPKIVSP